MNNSHEIFPEDLYAVFKMRAWDLMLGLQNRSLKVPVVMNALAVGLGFEDAHRLKATLDRLAGADVRDLDRETPSTVSDEDYTRIEGLVVLQKHLANVEVLPEEEWARLREAVVTTARRLGLPAGVVVRAAAKAWCDQPNWPGSHSEEVAMAPCEGPAQDSSSRRRRQRHRFEGNRVAV